MVCGEGRLLGVQILFSVFLSKWSELLNYMMLWFQCVSKSSQVGSLMPRIARWQVYQVIGLKKAVQSFQVLLSEGINVVTMGSWLFSMITIIIKEWTRLLIPSSFLSQYVTSLLLPHDVIQPGGPQMHLPSPGLSTSEICVLQDLTINISLSVRERLLRPTPLWGTTDS